MYIWYKFEWNLKRWVSGMSYFHVEFPYNQLYYCSLRISHLPQFRIFIKIQHFWDGKWDFNHCPHVVIRRDTFFSCKPFVTVHFPNQFLTVRCSWYLTKILSMPILENNQGLTRCVFFLIHIANYLCIYTCIYNYLYIHKYLFRDLF